MTVSTNGTVKAPVAEMEPVAPVVEPVAPVAPEPDSNIATDDLTFYGDIRTRKVSAFSHDITAPHFLPLRGTDGKQVTLPSGAVALSTEQATRKQVHAAMLADLTAMQRNGHGAALRRDGSFIADSGDVITITYHNGKQDCTRRVRLCAVVPDASKQPALAYVAVAAKQADGTYVLASVRIGNLKAVAGNK